jgi:hypothetical protein
MLERLFPQQADDRLVVEDVFSTWLYTGNGSTQTITNGIDLAGKGGLVWQKPRNNSGSYSNQNKLWDTVRGAGNTIYTDSTQAQETGRPMSFTSSGFSLDAGSQFYGMNETGINYASWTFREAPKFFDVVTYTGDGTGFRTISHSLGIVPGIMILKKLNTTSDWIVTSSFAAIPSLYAKAIYLNKSDAADAFNQTGIFDATNTLFYVGATSGSPNFGSNDNGTQYVAYLFAHDPSADGIIQCGTFNNSGGPVTVTLGWEPQWILMKNAAGTGDWFMVDNMRGMPVGGSDPYLYANSSASENSGDIVTPTATGFVTAGLPGSTNFIYMAIRRGPMRTPTLGTSVFAPITYTGNGATPRNLTGAGFPPDYAIQSDRGSGTGHAIYDKLRGAGKQLITNTTAAEASVAGGNAGTMLQDGIVLDNIYDNYNLNGNSYITHFFRRAPGFFDEVCYTGTGVTRTIAHNLGVAPELMIVKRRNDIGDWVVYVAPLGATKNLYLQASNGVFTNPFWNDTNPTSSVFTIGGGFSDTNASGSTYVAYLFASVSGVSKVGSYTGNGSSQTINCAFTTGARFVLIKRTDSTGDWYVWDSARGIVAGNDPYLALNTTAGEVTNNDSVDPDSTGFIVNQVAASNINVNAATYIFLAIA